MWCDHKNGSALCGASPHESKVVCFLPRSRKPALGGLSLCVREDSVTLVDILFRYLIKYLTPSVLTEPVRSFNSFNRYHFKRFRMSLAKYLPDISHPTRRDSMFVPHILASPRLGSSPLSRISKIPQYIHIEVIYLLCVGEDSNLHGCNLTTSVLKFVQSA